jgi:hypothetical protein
MKRGKINVVSTNSKKIENVSYKEDPADIKAVEDFMKRVAEQFKTFHK